MTFLSDLFYKLNSLNLSLRGPSKNIITVSSKLKSFGETLLLWQSKILKRVFDCFPTYKKCASNKEITPEILYTLTHLQSVLQHCFQQLQVMKMNESAIHLETTKLQTLQLKKNSSSLIKNTIQFFNQALPRKTWMSFESQSTS